MKSFQSTLILITALLTFCTPTKEAKESGDNETSANPAKLVTSANGMVAAAQPLASQAGSDILARGGNAADAAVATAFVIAVVEPTMNGIGGRNQILVRKSDGSLQGYNGMTEVPASFLPDDEPVNSGHRVIAIPGVVAGLMRLHKEHGSMPLAELMKPAIRIAAEGFELLEGEAKRHGMGLEDIKNDPGFHQIMLKGDTTYATGDVLKQSDLAKTLQRIADTHGKDFYEGETAKMIATDMTANNGFVTIEDLKNYRALDARQVSTSYRGYEIHSIPAPAGGGLVIKALNIMEQFNLSNMSDAQWAAVVNQALTFAIQSMDYDYKEEDLDQVQSKKWAKEMAAKVIVPQPVDSRAATSVTENQMLLAHNTDWSGDTWGADSHHTSHFVTADCSGMVVSITQTIGPLFGSKVITPGLGFVYASTMGAYIAGSDQTPGSRPRTAIAPTIVSKDGETLMVLGAAGGLRILSGIVQTISRVVDQEKNIYDAVSAPRIHPKTDYSNGSRTVFATKFSAEYTPMNGWASEDSIYWQENGFEIEAIDRYGAFSRIHVIARDPKTNTWSGMADLDWEGTAQAPAEGVCEE